MSKQSIYIGRIFGIPVRLDFSWFFVVFFFSYLLAVGYFPHQIKDASILQYWAAGLLTSLLLFGSVLLHELGHALVARIYSIPVRRIKLMVFGGVAQFEHEPESAASEFWTALGGPFVNILLGILLYFVQPLFQASQWSSVIVYYLMYINFILAVFNLIPGFPLDGGRVFRAIVWAITHNLRKATVIAAGTGRFIAFSFIFWGAVQILHGYFADGLWILFIGWFLDSAAAAQIQQSDIRALLEGHTVREAMSKHYGVIEPDISLQTLVDYHIIGEGRRSLIVQKDGKVLGMLTLHHLREIPADMRDKVTVQDVMMPLEEIKRIHPDTPLWQAFTEMQQDGVNQLPVLKGEKLIGLLTRENIFEFLNQQRG